MADRFPRANVNPAAAPWTRAVEKRVLAAEALLRRINESNQAQGRVLASGRYKAADGSIYRRNGVVVPAGSPDFTIYAGGGETQGADQDESGETIFDPPFASLNVQPGIVQLRQYDPASGLYGYTRQTTHAFEASWSSVENLLVQESGDELMGGAHWAIQWEWENPATSSYWGNGRVQNRQSIGSLFDGIIQVNAFQTFDADGAPTSSFTVTAVTINGYVGGGGGTTDPATTDAAGIVELATDAEAVAGTDASRAVTPHSLAAALAGAGTNLADAWRGEWVAP